MKLRRRRKKAEQIDERLTHLYVGPTTIYGLREGTAVRLGGAKGRSGLVLATDAAGKAWRVPRAHLVARAHVRKPVPDIGKRSA